MKSRLLGAISASVFVLGISTSASAALVTYDSRTAFQAAITAYTGNTVTFDGASVGDTIPSGSAFGDITFTYSLVDLASDPLTMVVDGFLDTTTAPNYLALQTMDGDFVNFLSGDSFAMAFAQPKNALGLYIIANDTMLLGDSFSLTVAGLDGIISGPLAPSTTLTDGGQVYFLGVTSDLPFTSAIFGSNGSGLEFALDDITHAAVPLPASLWLLASGLGFIGVMARRKVNS